MSIPQLVKQIHQLTYKEMLAISAEISTVIMMREGKREPDKPAQGPVIEDVAAALLALTSPTDTLAQEENILQEVFNRKRTFSVARKGKGWTTDIPTLPGAQASAANLREALNQTLDQIVTLQALQK